MSKSIVVTQTEYKKGDYVFAKASAAGGGNSMYIALKDFKSTEEPSTDKVNWREFTAPRGGKGENGDVGQQGPTGPTGPGGDEAERENTLHVKVETTD